MHAENPVWQKELIVWIICRRFQEMFKNKLDFMMLATGFKTKTQVDIITCSFWISCKTTKVSGFESCLYKFSQFSPSRLAPLINRGRGGGGGLTVVSAHGLQTGSWILNYKITLLKIKSASLNAWNTRNYYSCNKQVNSKVTSLPFPHTFPPPFYHFTSNFPCNHIQ